MLIFKNKQSQISISGISDRWRSSLLATAMLITLLFLAGPGCDQSSKLRDFGIDTDFQMSDQDGAAFSSGQLRGKTVWLYFGFTRCPDVCPGTLAKLARAYNMLDFRRENLQAVMITVDPEHDTPERLKAYLDYFDLPLIGLNADLDYTRTVAAQFGANFERQILNSETGEYTVDHSTRVFLIDPEGRVRYAFAFEDSATQIASVTGLLLPLY
ncbi:MAG: SCO family protein [Leptospiraceae bacterium]|nr:SCO family protein [Leptospiraceae bacterium]MCB1316131.1 SCO family protein [Leptospiraceae bacterium]MCB1318909.1 SCO family protein [Leptospiraceae bacterium]